MATKFTRNQILGLPDGKHRVEKGLFLLVRGSRRSWLYSYSFRGKQYRLGLGSALTVPLSAAKELRDQALALLLSGNNPMDVRRGVRVKNASMSFKDYWELVFPRIAAVKNWTNPKVKMQWKNTVDCYAVPIIGKVPIQNLTRDDILRCIEPIWWTKTETASKVRMRLETILNVAVADGYLKTNPAAWKANLDIFLPSKAKIHDVRHYAALHHSELKKRINLFNPSFVSHALIVFTILTASRVGESYPAKWEEIDLVNRVWSVPAERRKDGKKVPHRVPLSTQAVEVLRQTPRVNDYVFPSSMYKNKPVHMETARHVLRKVFKDQKVTIHGMRSTFRDWAAETGVRDIVAEKCLMHSTGSDVVQAYQRSDLLEARRKVMQDWADYLLSNED